MAPSFLILLKNLLVDVSAAATELEFNLPDDVKKNKWMAAKHSPSPWNAVHSHYCNTECDPALLLALAIRSQLAEAMECLNWCIVQAEAADRPIGSLKLAKQRRYVP